MSVTLLLWALSAGALAAQAGRWRRALDLLARQAESPCGAPTRPRTTWLLTAARDEAESLPALAAALAAQAGTQGALRPVLVDDGSRDGTAELARLLLAPWPDAEVLAQPAAGKLAALDRGLGRILAQADDWDLVLFTDADSRPAPGWQAAHEAAAAGGAEFCCGHVRLDQAPAERASRAGRFRRFENAVSSLQAALGCVLGRPAFARGANWSARAGALRRAGGLEGLQHLASGDDVHLVRRLVRAGVRARFLLEPASQVWTRETGEPAAAAQQARRRYGKLRDLPGAEQWRQGALFAALAAQLLLLAGWGLSLRPSAVLPMAVLLSLGWATRDTLRRGFVLLHEQDLADQIPRQAPRLAWHALRHSLCGALRGYHWRDTVETGPAAGAGRKDTG